MTNAEIGAWIRVLGAMWATEKPGRMTARAVARVAGAEYESVRELLEADGDWLIHRRTQRDYAAQSARIAAHRAKSAAGGKSKAEKEKAATGISSGLPEALPKPCPPSFLPSVTPSPQKKKQESDSLPKHVQIAKLAKNIARSEAENDREKLLEPPPGIISELAAKMAMKP